MIELIPFLPLINTAIVVSLGVYIWRGQERRVNELAVKVEAKVDKTSMVHLENQLRTEIQGLRADMQSYHQTLIQTLMALIGKKD